MCIYRDICLTIYVCLSVSLYIYTYIYIYIYIYIQTFNTCLNKMYVRQRII